MNKSTGILGCIAALTAIALGAFGAHALKEFLSAAETQDVWQTAVDYHMWHALALVLCAVMVRDSGTKRAAVALFVVGILLFSGSLYWLALGGPRWLGPITPLGGLSFMVGWLCLGIEFLKGNHSD